MSKFDQIATVHKLTVVKQADEHDSEFDVYLCEDQFGNEWALSKEGEPEYAEWGVYNYIVRNNVCTDHHASINALYVLGACRSSQRL
ncbi:hypothetical protein ACP5PY_27615 [Photobacterium leiognathi subsp. mandapamensis]